MGENSEVVNAACHPSQFGCTSDVTAYDYDPEKAKALLAEAARPTASPSTSTAIATAKSPRRSWAISPRSASRANLRWLQYSAARDLIREGKAPAANMTWGSSPIPDVSAITSYFFGGGPDDPAKDPALQEAIRRADLSSDRDVRLASYAEALQLIADEAYWLPLFSYTKNYSYNAQLDFTLRLTRCPASTLPAGSNG